MLAAGAYARNSQFTRNGVAPLYWMGFKFLRCDFLCNFQNAYGDDKYSQALKWISEEAGDEIIVSLVMPNSHDRNKIENNYGDMFRICVDCFTGGWEFISSRGRGRHNGGWPQFENLFDGFVYFSTISRTTTMMDGDFVRLNTCKRPEEKAFWISLLVMAGSPIAIADQYNTIGSDAHYYQNPRLLELVGEGFSGKPLSTDLKNKEQSSIWCGKRKDGTYVAAFFNREEQPVTYSLSLGSKLGFRSAIDVVDLWTGDTQQGSTKYNYTAEAELHYTKDDLLPVQFYTQWEENGPLQPLRSGCLGLPSEADGLYQITFNARTLQVTTTLLLDPDGLRPVGETADGIVEPNDTYDLLGRKVARPSKGIYIVGGRKIVR